MTPVYIGPERQLKGLPPLSTDEIIAHLIDEAYLAAEDFRHTHSKGSLISIVQIVVRLNKLGYDFLWDRRRHIVGATLKSTPASARNTNATLHTIGGQPS